MARRKARRKQKKRIARGSARVLSRAQARGHSKKKRPRPEHPRSIADLRIAAAIREMNRGRSLTAAARSLRLSRKNLEKAIKQKRLAKRQGRRWVTKDNRPRRVPVMTGGRFRVVTVHGYKQARLVGEHHHAVGQFVRTNALEFIKPFHGRSVQAVNGRKYLLETNPNALHRIAAMDTPPFHEIYEITSTN